MNPLVPATLAIAFATLTGCFMIVDAVRGYTPTNAAAIMSRMGSLLATLALALAALVVS